MEASILEIDEFRSPDAASLQVEMLRIVRRF
jgi:hypothetical protein